MTTPIRILYLAGPMRGYPRYNFDAFADAQRRLEAEGFKVMSPHQMDLILGFDPDLTLAQNEFDLNDAVRRDIDAIIKSDAVVVLPNWENSVGASAEIGVARWLGRPVLILAEILPQ